MSIEHWEQICEAIEAGENVIGHFGEEECAFCHLHLNKAKHSDCLLYESGGRHCCQEWRDFINNRTLLNAQAMLNRLYMERGKMYGKPKDEPKKEKPREIRHGDYGIDVKERPFLACQELYENEVCSGGKDGWIDPVSNLNDRKPDTIFGNIFDDLARNAEDLRKFAHDRTTYILEDDGRIRTRHEGEDDWLLNYPEKTHQLLGQMIATAKRDSSCKK